MNPAYSEIIAASDRDREGLFAETAAKLGTAIQNVEKDFWVCWTLDALFNGMQADGPRLLFKGGTSLSKAFGLIPRFSEDIDITVFREDLGYPIEAAALEALSGKQRRRALNEIRDSCRAYITGPFAAQLSGIAQGVSAGRLKLEADPDDADGQTLLLWYPSAARVADGYIRSAVKIEAGAKSALDPHMLATVTPYVASTMPDSSLQVGNVVTVQAERTFWDKVVILHGLRQWFDRRGLLRHGGQRVSRHYYDVHQLLQHQASGAWLQNHELAADCAVHARMFFGSPDLGLDTAARGTFTLMPSDGMLDALRADYQAMRGMVFGPVPPLEDIVSSVAALEGRLNV